MAKTVKITGKWTGPSKPCDQCGKHTTSGVELEGTGFLGIREGIFCSSGCEAAYARDRGWTLK